MSTSHPLPYSLNLLSILSSSVGTEGVNDEGVQYIKVNCSNTDVTPLNKGTHTCKYVIGKLIFLFFVFIQQRNNSVSSSRGQWTPHLSRRTKNETVSECFIAMRANTLRENLLRFYHRLYHWLKAIILFILKSYDNRKN
ncbi:hypothetical protein J6590_049767 [Homalodisca vitripennis]|nr:hypothetical protein J6590_049767 [Homalodisca vitripennis]